jgi:gamma-glutamyltranspeptidase/glutathione hydrolase
MIEKVLSKNIGGLLLLFGCLSARAQQILINPYSYAIQKKVTCTHGAVVSAHPIASTVGVSILQQGGNAVDAAIATQLALAVVYPAAGNIGGGGFMIARLASGQNIAIDFREEAPGKAFKDMYLDSAGNAQSMLSLNGHLASGVPGSVAGIFEALRYARLPLNLLVQPAIDLAEKGFTLTATEASSLNHLQEDLKKYNTRVSAFVKTSGWKAGDTLVQKDLAKTLTRIRDQGAKGFYEGETARLIAEEMQRGKGLVSIEDLKKYKAIEREAVVFNYKKEYTIITMPLPSSAGVLLPQMMRMIEDQPVKSYGFESLKAVHLMTEIERLAYADRAKWLGDNDFYKVPVKTLISYAYVKDRMKLYNPDKAGDSKSIQGGSVRPESTETTHFDVYDQEGNAVSLTTTLNGGYGSRTVVGGAGFFMNNEMDDFSIKPGVPNTYGAVGAEANAIEPGKRMLSSMTPTIVLDSGKPYLIVGTPGGTTITTSVFQTLMDILEFEMSAEDAVNKPKFHHQWLPDQLLLERDFPADLKSQLENMGYKIIQTSSIGRTEVIRIHPDGKIEAVGDKRGEDTAEGY